MSTTEEETHKLADEMSAEELAEAKLLGKYQLVCTLADMAIDLLVYVVAAFYLAWPVDAYLQEIAFLSNETSWGQPLRLAVLLLLLNLGHELVSLPLSFYSGFVVEHRFGLSRMSLSRWLVQHYKMFALTVVFMLPFLVALYMAILMLGWNWWWVAAIAFFVVQTIFGRLFPVLILPLFYPSEPLDDPALAQRLAQLAEGTGLTIEGIFRLKLSEDTVKANAMLAGAGRTRRVLLADTLLDEFNTGEIEVVMAHEIAHHVYRHTTWLLWIGGVVSGVMMYLAQIFVVAPLSAAGDFPVAGMVMLLLFFQAVMLPLQPLVYAIIRVFERQCDRYALRKTAAPDAFRSAFRKLARQNKADPAPSRLEVVLLEDHPPIQDRLKLADEYEAAK